jgi:hypothetical protein
MLERVRPLIFSLLSPLLILRFLFLGPEDSLRRSLHSPSRYSQSTGSVGTERLCRSSRTRTSPPVPRDRVQGEAEDLRADAIGESRIVRDVTGALSARLEVRWTYSWTARWHRGMERKEREREKRAAKEVQKVGERQRTVRDTISRTKED